MTAGDLQRRLAPLCLLVVVGSCSGDSSEGADDDGGPVDGAEDVGGSGEAGEAGDVGVPEPATEFPVERLLYEDNLAYLADSPGRGAELQDVELAEDRVYVCAGWGFLIYDLPQPDTPFRRFPPLTGWQR